MGDRLAPTNSSRNIVQAVTAYAIRDFACLHPLGVATPSPLPVDKTEQALKRGAKGWETCKLSLRSTKLFINDTVCVPSISEATLRVVWAYEEKSGHKFQFRVSDPKQPDSKHAVSFFEVPSRADLESWLIAFQSQGCTILRPRKLDILRLAKERYDGWSVLYSDALYYFRRPTDANPAHVIAIGEGSVVEVMSDHFCLVSNDQASTLTFSSLDWFDAITPAVDQKRAKKFPDSILEGSLLKSGKNMGWKRRYCVLMPDHIQCFKTRFHEKPSSLIRLPPGSDAEGLSATDARKFQFWVSANGDEAGTRRYKLAAPNATEKEEWLRALTHLFTTKDNRVNLLSIKEGYLYKNHQGVWSKKYFVLLEGALFYVANRNDFLNPELINFKINYVDTKKVGYINLVNRPELLPVVSFDTIAIAEHGDESTTTCLLRAPSRVSQKEWFDALHALLRQHDVQLSPDSIQEGFLRRQTKKRAKWSRGYFVLHDDSLEYYQNRSDTAPTATLCITATTDLAQIPGDPNHPFRFTLGESEQDEKKNYFFTFSCDSAETRTRWMTNLSAQIKAKNVRMFEDSVLEGFLWKKKSRLPQQPGQKYYFVLRGNTLQYFKRLGAPGSRVLHIVGECELMILENADYPFMFSVAQSGDEGEKVVKIYCRDLTSRTEWVDALKQQIARFPQTKVSPDSLREGYVEIRKDGVWRKRFFILDRNSFSLFPKRIERKPELTLPLREDTVVALLDHVTPAGLWGHLDTCERCPPPDVKSWREIDIERELRDRQLEAFADNMQVVPTGSFVGFSAERQAEELRSTIEDGLQLVMCNNADPGKVNLRLRNVDESLASQITDICLSKEFAKVSRAIVKSGDLMVTHSTHNLDPWRTSFVTLKKNKLFVESQRGVRPVTCVVTLNSSTEVQADESGRIHISDGKDSLQMKPQSDEEYTSWITALRACLSTSPATPRIVAMELFGSDLKTSFQHSAYYRLPSVITPCIESLKLSRSIHCLLRHPGFYPHVRSLIQDFEHGVDVPLKQAESVAACLRVYLFMLADSIVPDVVSRTLIVLVGDGSDVNLPRVQELLQQIESNRARCLSFILYYLKGELARGVVTPADVAETWSPLLLKSLYPGEGTLAAPPILHILIQHADYFYPIVPIPLRKLPATELQQIKAEYLTTRFDSFRKSSFGMDLFTQWARENLLPENIGCLNAVLQYRQMCKSVARTQGEMREAARLICATHVRPGVEQQVNISADLADSVLAAFNDEEKPLNGQEFLPIEREVHLLLVTNEYPRFQKTELFEEWITFRHLLKTSPSPPSKGLIYQSQQLELSVGSDADSFPVPRSGLLDDLLKQPPLLAPPLLISVSLCSMPSSSPFLQLQHSQSLASSSVSVETKAEEPVLLPESHDHIPTPRKPIMPLERAQTLTTFSSVKPKSRRGLW